MAGASDNRKLGYRIFLGVVVLVLGGSMLLYLVPQTPGTGEAATDTVAKVGDQSVTLGEVRQQLAQIEQRNQVPKPLESLYARQILNQLVFEKELEYEAKRLGITVTDQERADRIKQYVPGAFNNGTFVGMDRYATEVQARFQLSVPVFEELIRQGLLEEKFRKLVTDGISVGPGELQDEFRYKNEKIKVNFVVIKPEELAAKINPTEAEIKAEYEKNKSRYQVPETRVVRYALLDTTQMRRNIQVSDDQLKVQYQNNIQQYQVPNRVHVEHILFMTVGKTDAEVEEIKKNAEDVLKQAKKFAKFEDLAKKYSEDPGSKEKGGDLGWITQGQTVPEFEKTAFGLDKGQISDLVKTQYGFHIIKVLDKETARTKTFDEVKESLRAPLVLQQADQQATDAADRLAKAIRQSNKVSLDDLAKQYQLTVSQTRPISATDPVLELGNSKEVKDAIFRLRQNELSLPIRTDRGYVVLSVQQITLAHQGSLDEVRERVGNDLKQEEAGKLAKAKAEELAKRIKAGEKFEAAAKALGLEAKTSDLITRNDSIAGAASGKQLGEAFQMKPGDVGTPMSLGSNWMVYRVEAKEEPNPNDFEKQKKSLAEQLLQTKRSVAYEAFKTALDTRLKQEGKVKLMTDKMAGFGSLGS
ncbi:MAG TPA: peptidyl-prolyl cis-trans isomerase [Candidatus Acidoferrum sp.]|jgi:peptidyl-prolyl cis-trans isomerase D|nr:peptidyl-prolyl cis-trans isomerase [Candidatus Acidoferrum sp.]